MKLEAEGLSEIVELERKVFIAITFFAILALLYGFSKGRK